MSSIIETRESERFFEFLFAHPEEFETLKQPEDVQKNAQAVASGASVSMGASENSPEEIQSVKIPKRFGKNKARDLARKISRQF